MRQFLFAGAALLALQAGSAMAEEKSSSGNALADAQAATTIVGPENEPQTGIATSAVSFNASNSDSEVTLTLAPKNDGLLTRTGSTSWAATLKAPLDKDAGSGSFVTELGLSNKFSAGFSLTRIFGRLGSFHPPRDAAVARYVSRCHAAARLTPEWAAKPEGERADFEREKCGTAGDVAGLPEAFLGLHAAPDDVRLIKSDETAHARTSVSILNISAELGYNEYEFFSASDFSEGKEDKLSYAVSVSYGINPSRSSPFFGAGYEYKREFEAPDKKTICPASNNPGSPVECKSAVFGEPEKKVSHNVFALARYADFFKSNRTDSRTRLPIAAEVRLGYDLHDKILGASVPVYFLLDDKGGFRGGVRFDWANGTKDSSADEFKFGVFVVKSFDFFGL
jgi:hypothetical protein